VSTTISREYILDLQPNKANSASCWYKRQELGLRAAMFFSAAALAGSFGGLLAAAITQMHGIGGYEGWRWICMFLSSPQISAPC
jgi:MFS family permease